MFEFSENILGFGRDIYLSRLLSLQTYIRNQKKFCKSQKNSSKNITHLRVFNLQMPFFFVAVSQFQFIRPEKMRVIL